MKRTLSLLLTAVILFSGCGLKKQLTAFGLYSKAASDISKAGGMEAECDITIDLGILASSLSMNLKQNGDNSEVVVYMAGEEVSRSTTYDGVTYLSSNGTKTKSAAEPSSSGTGSSAIPKLAEELFDGVEIVNTDTGKSLTVSIDSDTFSSLMESFSGASPDLSFDDAVLTMNFDENDSITGMELSANATMAISEISMDAVVTADYKFINLGKAPEISPPEDADKYIEAK